MPTVLTSWKTTRSTRSGWGVEVRRSPSVLVCRKRDVGELGKPRGLLGCSELMKPSVLGHDRVMSPNTAWARVESSSKEQPGRRFAAGCRTVLSGIVVGGWESQPQGEGPDRRVWRSTIAGVKMCSASRGSKWFLLPLSSLARQEEMPNRE